MFNLQQYSEKIAVITDRGEKLTYAELYTKVEDFQAKPLKQNNDIMTNFDTVPCFFLLK